MRDGVGSALMLTGGLLLAGCKSGGTPGDGGAAPESGLVPDGGASTDGAPPSDAGGASYRRCDLEVEPVATTAGSPLHSLGTPTVSGQDVYFWATESLAGDDILFVQAGSDDVARVVREETEVPVVGFREYRVGQLVTGFGGPPSVAPVIPGCELSQRVVVTTMLYDFSVDGPVIPEHVLRLEHDRGANARLVRLVAEGSAAPDTGGDTFDWFSTASMTACGDVGFFAQLESARTLTYFRLEPEGALSRVAGVGDTLPGASEPVTAIDFAAMNDSATVVKVHVGDASAPTDSVWWLADGDAPICLGASHAVTGCAVGDARSILRVSAGDSAAAFEGDGADGRPHVWAVASTGGAPYVDLTLGSETTGGETFDEVSHPVIRPPTRDVYFLGRVGGLGVTDVYRTDGVVVDRVTDFASAYAGEDAPFDHGATGMSVSDDGWLVVIATGEAGRETVWVVSPDGRLARGPTEGERLPHTSSGGAMDGEVDRLAVLTGANARGRGGASLTGPDDIAFYALFTDSESAIYRARWPADDCAPQIEVNTTGDGGDAEPGDGSCDTGANAPNGDPECTLRAAIEEAEASAGADQIRFAIAGAAPHVIEPGAALPDLTDPLSIVATPGEIVLDGSGAGASTRGISCFVDGGCRIDGLTIRAFGGDGVYSAGTGIELSAVTIVDNCGWGAWVEGTVSIDAASEVSRNGTGDACRGGGVYAGTERSGAPRPAEVRLTNVTVDDNGGPGVFATGNVVVAGSRIRRNVGEGIAAYPGAGAATTGADFVRVDLGVTEISENTGHGIFVDAGEIEATLGAQLLMRDNAGWAIWAAGGQVTLGAESASVSPEAHEIVRNGRGPSCRSWSPMPGTALPELAIDVCRGGAILAVSDGSGHRVFLENATIAENDGPGVLTNLRIKTGQNVRVRDNRGQGLVVAAPVGLRTPEVGLDVIEPGLVVSGNAADGVELVAGGLSVGRFIGFEVRDNGGHGVRIEGPHDVDLPASIGGPTPVRVISGNGARATCEQWSIDDVAETGTVASGPCDGGGMRGGATIRAHDLTVRDNAGPGVYATGDLELTDSTVCNHTGTNIDAGGTITLTRVTSSCP